MAKPVIDVSENNGVLNWDLIQPQIDGVIIRCGFGGNVPSQDDKQYVRNVQACDRLHIPKGVYLFSYARNAQEAEDEADHVLRLVKGYNFELPIYYDLEYTAYVGELSPEDYTSIAHAFGKRIEAAGGFVGIYSNLSFWLHKLYQVNEYTRWLAQWASEPTYEPSFQLWQYTSNGRIDGSSARTDLSKWYGDFFTMSGRNNYFANREPVTPDPLTPSLRYKVGDHVKFNALFTNSESTKAITNIAVHEGTITKVLPNARNPYLINDGTGWVNDQVIEYGDHGAWDDETAQAPTRYQVGDIVNFKALYTSSTSPTPLYDIAVTSGQITKIQSDAPNPYLINNGTGWVNDRVITQDANASPLLRVGERVKVRYGATDYNGTPLASFVYQGIYEVQQVNGNRVVIGRNGQVTAAVDINDLIRV